MAYTSSVMRKILKPSRTVDLINGTHSTIHLYSQKSFIGELTLRGFGFWGRRKGTHKLKSTCISHSGTGLRAIGMFQKENKLFARKHPFAIHKKSICSMSDEVMAEKKYDVEEMHDWIDTQREQMYEIPMVIIDEDVDYLCTLESNNQRKKFLRKLFKKEQKELAAAEKTPSEVIKPDDKNVVHNLSKSFVLRSRRVMMQDFHRGRVAAAMRFGPDVALDFIYDQEMLKRQAAALVTQLSFVNKANMLAQDPFHLHLVNCNMDGQCMTEMRRRGFSTDNMMVDVTSQGLLEVFQQEDIIYICPDSKNIIKSYDPNKVYVIPALCSDGSTEHTAVLAQVKKLGVEHGRFYGGFPNLTGYMDLLIALNATRNFAKAFKMGSKGTPVGKSEFREGFTFSRAQHKYKWDIDG